MNKDNEIRISVIIPLYNSTKYISQTLDSIFAQISSELDEVIIIDDCSTDNPIQVIDKYLKLYKNLKFVLTEKNSGGPATPRNLGLSIAKGKYVAFCDADDIWHPQKIAFQLKALEHFDFVCSGMVDFSYSLPVNINHTYKPPKKLSKLRFFAGNPIPNSSVICNASIIRVVGGFNQDRKLVAVEDFDLWMKLGFAGYELGKIQLPLIFYRKSLNQISSSKIKMAGKVFHLYAVRFNTFVACVNILFYSVAGFLRTLRLTK